MPIEIDPIGPSLNLGEGPFWDDEARVLYYVDINNHTIHSYNPSINKHHSVNVESEGNPVSLVIKVQGEKNKFVISVKNSLAVIFWDGTSSVPVKPQYLMDLEGKENANRINDGKCDPSNRLWAGTMGTKKGYDPEKGSLYFVNKEKTIVKQLSKIGISNGLAWSSDKTKFYYIDSLKFRVDSYDYNDTNGSLSNEQTVFCFKKNNIEGFPDGMTIDIEGMLWIACFGGAQILRVDPMSGELKQSLELPSLQITSVVFGGPNFEDLYITSAKVDFTKELEEKYPQAGRTFRITGLQVKGTPSVPIEL